MDIYDKFCGSPSESNMNLNFEFDLEEPLPVIYADQHMSDYQNQVWIDPARSPFVYNHYEEPQYQQYYTVSYQSGTNVTVHQNNTYQITEYSLTETNATIYYATCEDIKSNIQVPDQQMYSKQYDDDFETGVILNQLPEEIVYENNQQMYSKQYDDDFESGVILNQQPAEIIYEKHQQGKEETKFVGLQDEHSALKQLMSPDIQSLTRQRKTILFLGPDSKSGQTIQQIGYYDPNMECADAVPGIDHEVFINDSKSPKRKRYQCAKCRKIFDTIAEFREHTVIHEGPKHRKCKKQMEYNDDGLRYICGECGKSLKSKEKYEKHSQGHGNPELECDVCFKVYASKFTLKSHRKIHNRKHHCPYCPKAYSTLEEMRCHCSKAHDLLTCDQCDYTCRQHSELQTHKALHKIIFKEILPNGEIEQNINNTSFNKKDLQEIYTATDKTSYNSSTTESDMHDDNYKLDSSSTDITDSLFSDVLSDENDPDWKIEESPKDKYDKPQKSQSDYEIRQAADSVIAKVISNQIFLAGKLKKNNKRSKKICDVCQKSFDRVSDLKRHLIEHIVKSTLAKTPVSRGGTLTMKCEVCQQGTFTKVDHYKAHLREHAKLTLYQCTFCNKSFSDSSNFSKHKKIHGATFLQCDLCQRKFNSKKMLIRHMDYHKENEPLPCQYCDREFHFESMLNKHIKSAHTKNLSCRFRCRFCSDYFTSLKNKWDHEWKVHNVRKAVMDCTICGEKFRKYAELKRHCIRYHNIEIPRAKNMLK